jgi:hypothetical protein
MKPATLTVAALLAVVALLAAGCGGGSGSSSSSSTGTSPATNPGGPMKEATAPNAPAGSKVASCDAGVVGVHGLRAGAIDCGAAKTTMQRWQGDAACAPAPGPRSPAAGESRKACALGRWRCQAVVAGRGTAVSCARPEGGDISFLVTRRPTTAGAGR